MEIEKLSEKLIWVYEHGPFDDKVLRTRALSTPNLMEFEPAQFFFINVHVNSQALSWRQSLKKINFLK